MSTIKNQNGRGIGFFFALFLVSFTVLVVDLLLFKGENDCAIAQSPESTDSGRVLLLAFTSENCPACRALEPLVAGLEKKNYPIRRLSPDDPADMALYRQFQIETMPSFILLADGQESERFITSGEPIGVVQNRLLTMFQKAQAISTPAPAPAPISTPAPAPSVAAPSVATPSDASMIPNQVPIGNENIAQVGFTTFPEKGPAASTVRLRVTAGGKDLDTGTGTLIHANETNQSREGLILTCGHLFRESQGKSPVAVDLFNPADGKMTTVSGECVFYDDDLDIGFVGIPLPFPMEPAKLVPPGYLPKSGDAVLSVGCSSGENPTVWDHSIMSTDKKFYQPRTPNSKNHPFYFIEVSNAPRPGRSGGGLFVKSESNEYYLVGVCNAGDAQSDEGYFLPASVVYDQLFANRNLAFVYEDILRKQGTDNLAETQVAGFESEKALPSESRLNEFPASDSLSPYEQASSIHPAHFEEEKEESLTQNTPESGPLDAGLEELRRCHEKGAEIICIINWPKTSDSTSKESDVIRLSHP